ncbi:MAG: DEAD/DEAH box helicase, partial [Rhodospirillaceae bacterium]|nr:DEAD/DEAH box helicase [Rhodospirillaceae bacterium]
MRPQVLFSLFAPVTKLPGVGPRIAQALARVAGERIVDLLWHLPSGVVDRRYAPRLADAVADRVATVTITVEAHNAPPPGRGRIPYRITCSDGTGTLTLVFFHAQGDYLEKTLPVGEQRVVSGRIEDYQGTLQMTHPDHIVPVSEAESVMRVEPVYPLTAGLTPRSLGKAIQGALALAPELDEWADGPLKTQRGWAGWRDALLAAHAPDSAAALEPTTPARMRLAYDELLASQLALLLVRARQRQMPGRATKGDGALREKVLAALPFSLTGSQRMAIAEIEADMGSEARMLRLLQGDVGSGKTLVALMAMLVAVEAGRQAAMMAPTEILARQHHATIMPLAEAAGIEVLLLTGRDKGKARAAALERLAAGEIAHDMGLICTFMPKSDSFRTGNGMHMHLSVTDKDGKNLFHDDDDKNGMGLSALGYQFAGGLIKHAKGLCALGAPTVNSYKRLVVGDALSGATWAPAYISFGDNNRSSMLRVPYGRLELRTADGGCNPYLAIAGALAAGLDGIDNDLDPGVIANFN